MVPWAIDVDLVVHLRDPAEGDEMVLTLVVFLELDAVRPLHVIDDGELAVVRADDRGVGFDLIWLDHPYRDARPVPSPLARRFRRGFGVLGLGKVRGPDANHPPPAERRVEGDLVPRRR